MILFIFTSLIKALFQLVMTALGIFIVPFFMFRQEEFETTNKSSQILPDGSKNKRFKDKWFDYIFGNIEDGNCGDIYYFNKYIKLNWWTTYNWVAFRNPIHNLKLSMGVNEIITEYVWKGNRYTEDRIGHEGFVYSIATGQSGRKYRMIRWCKLLYKNYGIELNIGYKNFNIGEVNKYYRYSFTVSPSFFKKFEK